MIMNGNAFRIMCYNLILFGERMFGSHPLDWCDETFKQRFGISKSTFRSWGNMAVAGHKSINIESSAAVCNATGIRFHDLISKIINHKTYKHDYKVSRREFQTHVKNKFGLNIDYGLDKLYKEK